MLLHFDHCAIDINVVVVVDMNVDYDFIKTIEHNFVVDCNFIESIDIVADFAVLTYHNEF